jgi:hypothetical protein
MNALLQWATKLLGGWLPIGTKPFPEWLGKVLWAIGICLAVNFVISRFFPEKTVTNIGDGGVQIVYQEQKDMMGAGCSVMRAYLKAGVKAR